MLQLLTKGCCSSLGLRSRQLVCSSQARATAWQQAGNTGAATQPQTLAVANAGLLGAAASAGSSSSIRGLVTGHSHVPRAKHDRYRSPPTNYVQLLQHIARSRDVTGLSRLVKQYGPKFDAVHVSAAVSRLPRLYAPVGPGRHLNKDQRKERKQRAARLAAHLQLMASSQVPRMFARQVAAITHALARCGSILPGGGSGNPATQQLLHSMLSRMTQDNGRLLWQGASGPTVSFLLQGLALLGYAPGSGSSSSSSSSSAAAAAHKATYHLCKFIARHPERLRVRELATAAWALGRMHRRVPGLLGSVASGGDSAAAAALDVISREVVARAAYLAPGSMSALLSACVWLGRRDEALLAAIAEEAVAQQQRLHPPQLAVLAWSCDRLAWAPPPELLAAINGQAARQLEHFSAPALGLLLQGMRRLRALDTQLLAGVAAGIAAEEAVALSPRDAARILAAFVAQPTAGLLKDVEGMAARIASALRRSVDAAPPGVLTDLLVCYSKLPHRHPVLLRALEVVRERAGEFSMPEWAKLLPAVGRLYGDSPRTDPAMHALLEAFYDAADARLQQHLRGAALPVAAGADAAAGDGGGARPAVARPFGTYGVMQQLQQHDGGEEKGPLAFLRRLRRGRQPGSSTAAPAAADDAAAQDGGAGDGRQLHALQFSAAVDVGWQLGARGQLSDASAAMLADVGCKLLPQLKVRRLWLLLTAVTSRDKMLAVEDVRALVVAAVQHLQQQQPSAGAGRDAAAAERPPSATVLFGLMQPLTRALSRNLVLGSGEELMQGLYRDVAPLLEGASQEQVLLLWGALQHVPDGGLRERAQVLARKHGWQLSGRFMRSHYDMLLDEQPQ